MAAAAAIPYRTPDVTRLRVFAEIDQLDEAVSDLARLAFLHQSSALENGDSKALNLPEEGKVSGDCSSSLVEKPKWIEKEIETCKSFISELETACLTTPEKIKEQFEQFKTLLKRANPRLDSDFWDSIKEPTTLPELKERIENLLNDFRSIRFLCPLVPTKRGMNGPTFIVEYPRDGIRSYIAKWTSIYEIACNSLYAAFSNGFTRPGTMPAQRGDFSTGFFVPVTSGVIFDKNLHISCDGQVAEVPRDQTQRVKTHLLAIKKMFSTKEVKNKEIIFQQKIPGENFIDFILSNYSNLSKDAQIKFFQRLGRLAFLDLLLGNTDRFIRFNSLAKGKYAFHNTANLGNVMICTKKGALVIYAIDNGIEKALIGIKKNKKNYLQFLQKLFRKEQVTEFLAELMVSSIENGLDLALEKAQDSSESRAHARKRQAFLNSFRQIGKAAIQKGMDQMRYLMTARLLGEWEKAMSLKRDISGISPELLEAVTSRLDLFSRVVNK